MLSIVTLSQCVATIVTELFMNHSKLVLLSLISILGLSGCASYSVTEQEMTTYLSNEIHVEKAVGVPGLLYAKVSVEDVNVTIGRIDENRIAVHANTTADIDFINQASQHLILSLDFSAVPEYDKIKGEIYLKSLRLEKLEATNGELSQELTHLLRPAVSIIGHALSDQPAYKLDINTLKESLIKSSEPNLVIKDNKLVIALFN